MLRIPFYHGLSVRIGFVCFLCVMGGQKEGWGVTYTWNRADAANWTDASNWLADGVPNTKDPHLWESTDTVLVNKGVVNVAIDSDGTKRGTFGNVTLSNATIQRPYNSGGDFFIRDNFLMESGTMKIDATNIYLGHNDGNKTFEIQGGVASGYNTGFIPTLWIAKESGSMAVTFSGGTNTFTGLVSDSKGAATITFSGGTNTLGTAAGTTAGLQILDNATVAFTGGTNTIYGFHSQNTALALNLSGTNTLTFFTSGNTLKMMTLQDGKNTLTVSDGSLSAQQLVLAGSGENTVRLTGGTVTLSGANTTNATGLLVSSSSGSSSKIYLEKGAILSSTRIEMNAAAGSENVLYLRGGTLSNSNAYAIVQNAAVEVSDGEYQTNYFATGGIGGFTTEQNAAAKDTTRLTLSGGKLTVNEALTIGRTTASEAVVTGGTLATKNMNLGYSNATNSLGTFTLKGSAATVNVSGNLNFYNQSAMNFLLDENGVSSVAAKDVVLSNGGVVRVGLSRGMLFFNDVNQEYNLLTSESAETWEGMDFQVSTGLFTKVQDENRLAIQLTADAPESGSSGKRLLTANVDAQLLLTGLTSEDDFQAFLEWLDWEVVQPGETPYSLLIPAEVLEADTWLLWDFQGAPVEGVEMAAVEGVPEPSSVVLLCLGVFCFWIFRKKNVWRHEKFVRTLLPGIFLCGSVSALWGQIDNTATRVWTTLNPQMPLVGTLKPKRVDEISTSMWMIGCETVERENQDYHAYKEYLPELGIRRIRLQAGWSRCEQDKGTYDFGWLDAIVDDARRRGLEVFLETSYGNPLYPGGGGRHLSAGMPTSPEGKEGWNRWVAALAKHFADRVAVWGMWNEPENGGNTLDAIYDMNVRTAEILRKEIPDAKIAALSLCWPNMDIIQPFVERLQAEGKLSLFSWIVYHQYGANPDEGYGLVEKTVTYLQKIPGLKPWQGESGTQSEWNLHGANNKIHWNELTQAKWMARRCLGDNGRGIYSNVFTIADIHKRNPGRSGMFRYGLLKTTGQEECFRVLKAKIAFYAVQNIVSVFHDDVEITPEVVVKAECEKKLSVFPYRHKPSGKALFTFWDSTSSPKDSNATLPATFTLPNPHFENPVWVDTITGNVYQIPSENLSVEGENLILRNIPVYDAPVFITDREVLSLMYSDYCLHVRQEMEKKKSTEGLGIDN
ncbi:MAG: beta-galactosidase [Planctomycetia bacterium]|nr:beta-galactosidase [Planctomycetia bacterium]